MTVAAVATLAPNRRLEPLYEISKLFTAFDSIEATLDAALAIIADTLPLESAILIEAVSGHTDMLVWTCAASVPERVASAKAHAREAFNYMIGAKHVDAIAVREELGQTVLREPNRDRMANAARRFIVLPLVVEGSAVFGALQLEGASRLDRDDLVFVNAVTNQLAIAVDRARVRASELDLRREAQHLHAKYELLVDDLDYAFVWEAEATSRKITYISAQFERLLGYTRSACLEAADCFSLHVHPEDRAMLDEAFEVARMETGSTRCEHRCIAAGGEIRWFHTGIHLVDTPGEPRHLQGISSDITERRRARDVEQFLVRASMALNASLEFASVATIAAHIGVPVLGDACFLDLLALDGRVERVAWAHRDPELQAELDQTTDVVHHPLASKVNEVISTGVSQHVADAGAAWLPSAQLKVMQRGGPFSALIVPLILGARTFGAMTFCTSGDRAPRDGTVVAEELARRCALAIDHASLYDRARQAIAAREQTLAIVSHDLRTPLATIVMAASMLADPEMATSPELVARSIGKIQLASDRMDRMIGDLLDFASIEAGRLAIVAKPNDIAAILHEIVSGFEALAVKRGVTIAAESAPGLPLAFCDRDRILQVIGNLMNNAIKIVKRGGSVSVRAELREEILVISVADDGPGIALADQERLFDRYWRSASAEYRGTGLGLVIARSIVDAHRGQLWVDSEPGQGATFYLTLPLATAATASMLR